MQIYSELLGRGVGSKRRTPDNQGTIVELDIALPLPIEEETVDLDGGSGNKNKKKKNRRRPLRGPGNRRQRQKRNALKSSFRKWPDNTVPYIISGSFSKLTTKYLIPCQNKVGFAVITA